MRAFDEHKSGLQHSEACRRRITGAMAPDVRGAVRLENSEARINRSSAERVRLAVEPVEPLPGPSGTGSSTDVMPNRRVTFSSPGSEPAGRAPTPTRGADGARGSRKSPGPRGLMEAGMRHCPSSDDLTSTRQSEEAYRARADDYNGR